MLIIECPEAGIGIRVISVHLEIVDTLSVTCQCSALGQAVEVR